MKGMAVVIGWQADGLLASGPNMADAERQERKRDGTKHSDMGLSLGCRFESTGSLCSRRDGFTGIA
jgi:hypothetical protein